MRKVVLLVGHPTDPHLDYVETALLGVGADVEVLTTDAGYDRCRWSSMDGSIYVTSRSGRRDHPSEIGAIWNRRLLRPHLLEISDPEARHFAREQHWYARGGVLASSDAVWMNDPSANARASFKIEQLLRAQSAGLQVPPTLVSSNVEEIRSFAAALDLAELVTKVVSPGTPLVGDESLQYMVFAQSLRVAELDAAAIELSPAIYQGRVPKALEARSVVIGDLVRTCSIDSQSDERTSLDWRHEGLLDCEHQAIDLGGGMNDRLVSFVRSYGLNYGMIDLVLTPGGDWVFLELNPNGQWGWLEEHAGLPIAERLAHELAAAASG